MLAMRARYRAVGVVDPSYHDLAGLSSKKRTARGYGSADPSNTRIIAAICITNHWVANLVDKTNSVCYLFDPLHRKSNLKVLKSSVKLVIEPLIGMKDRLSYEDILWCTQKDGTSCGVWCLTVTELLLGGMPWVDNLYEVQPYLRLRYLFKPIGMQQCEVVL
ncbi:hypothetical protein DVH05_005386 [Phytophthora capsici]|nr:hypothetical protein DVH05_005386 [Phytophthora capsici]